MIGYKIIYLAKVCEGIRFFGLSVFIVTLIILFFWFLIWGAEEQQEKIFEKHPNAKKAILLALVMFILGVILNTFIPSRKDFAAMLAAKISSEKHLSLKESITLKQSILRLIDGDENQEGQ